MKTFKDNEGRSWDCKITTTALQRVRAGTGINVGDGAVLQSTIPKLLTDDLFAVEVAWQIIRPLAEAKKIGEAEFLDSMSGDVIAVAAQAIIDELADFFRKPGIRDLVKRLSDHAQAQMDLSLAAAASLIESPATSSSTSTDSPASSESTPQT